MLFSHVIASILISTCVDAKKLRDSDERIALNDAFGDAYRSRLLRGRSDVTSTAEARQNPPDVFDTRTVNVPESFGETASSLAEAGLSGRSNVNMTPEARRNPVDVFATRIVNVPESFGKTALSLAQTGLSIRGEVKLRPAAKDLPITKRSIGSYSLLQDTQSISLPGKLQSAPLYIFDIVALPQENSFAIFASHSRMISAVTQGASEPLSQDFAGLSSAVTDELTKLPVSLLSSTSEHTMKCAILKDKTVDGNCRGASQVLMCRVVGVDIADEFKRVKSEKQSLSILIGKDIAQISPDTLNAANIGMSISRSFLQAPNRSDSLRASLVHAMHGSVPPYINETIAYYKLMGVKHVYLGVFMEDERDSYKRAFQPYISSGYVSLLETDKWPGLSFQAKKDSFKSKGSTIEMWKTLINDLALYYSKNFDDLIFVNDYDELVVPTKGKDMKTLAVVEQILRKDNIVLNDLCFLSLCPQVTYGRGHRKKISRSEDFPFMDGGLPSAPSAFLEQGRGDPLRDFCEEGGYMNIYPKSIAVVETTYKTTVHVPGACSALHHNPLDGEAVGYHKEVRRNMGLIVQHFTELYSPGRYVPRGHREAQSAFSSLWLPELPSI
eukprot:TRINITY_DN22440_c0_g1_i1.p1 TRINITY_DN22440_c0_g1~~TRINITY_DN22440_c0_g1_i1.p1  ORF type:complete len:611 (-),score=38.98 TRINITY_DN22440_c0_g1_i1:181-2013(-)